MHNVRQGINQNMLNWTEKILEQNGSSGQGPLVQFWMFL